MNKFKHIVLGGHTQRKEYLHKLYTDRQVHISSMSSSSQPIEEEKIFGYRDITFDFEGTGYRTMERMVMFVYIPADMFANTGDISMNATAYEDYILRTLSVSVNELCQEYKNDHKSNREKPDFSLQSVNSVVQRRNGCIYMADRNAFRIRIHYVAPLINATYLNGKSMCKSVKAIMDLICNKLETINQSNLARHIRLYAQQNEIRAYIKANDYVAFVGNNSILPRQGDTEEPMMNAIPFLSPAEQEITIKLSDGTKVSGMGLRKGITVITGGGYSGKSTLLDSLEAGIYNHISGDGREYVITDETATKIYAEDGRYIENTDISPFFSYMPGNVSVNDFSTERASGSVSQATGIIEAIYGGCKMLMIDEDTSATNFMIRDEHMRLLVEKEPIIPFTDRIVEIKKMGISTILVIGGSGEYLKYADSVILMEDYIAKDKTAYINERIKPILPDKKAETDIKPCVFMQEKSFVTEKNEAEFFYSECVKIENARYIKIDNYVSDITKITSVITDEQINSLTYLLEKIMSDKGRDTDLLARCKRVTADFLEKTQKTTLSFSHQYELWLEQVRVIDLIMVACRMRTLDS